MCVRNILVSYQFQTDTKMSIYAIVFRRLSSLLLFYSRNSAYSKCIEFFLSSLKFYCRYMRMYHTYIIFGPAHECLLVWSVIQNWKLPKKTPFVCWLSFRCCIQNRFFIKGIYFRLTTVYIFMFDLLGNLCTKWYLPDIELTALLCCRFNRHDCCQSKPKSRGITR